MEYAEYVHFSWIQLSHFHFLGPTDSVSPIKAIGNLSSNQSVLILEIEKS